MKQSTRRGPTGRRANGAGTVTWNESRGCWLGKIRETGADGKRSSRIVSGATPTEVERKLLALRSTQADGVSVTAGSVESFAAYWLDHIAPATKSPETMARVRDRVERRVMTAPFAAKRLDKLTVEDVEAWLRAMPVKRRTMVDYRSDLVSIVNAAVRRRMVSWNAASMAVLPHDAEESDEKRILPPADAARLMRVLFANGEERLSNYFVLLLTTGMRPGEADALRWSDVDLDGGVVTVARGMKREDGGRPVRIGEPKGKKDRARRSFALSPEAVAAMRRERIRQAEDRLRRGYDVADPSWSDLVFLTEAGAPYWSSNLARALASFCRRAEVEVISPYECRHTAATLMLDAGMAAFDVADILGHVDTRMIERHYRHAVRTVSSAGATTMAGVFAGVREAVR